MFRDERKVQEQVIHLWVGAHRQAFQGQLLAKLTRRSQRLFALDEIVATLNVRDRRDAGMRSVPIHQILGSEGRAADFDRDFNPLQSHTYSRWQGMARARLQGRHMPPVDLIQVGDVYFVQDGHHRISVARALGQVDIEAEVTVWQVTGPMPWEMPAQEVAGVGRLYKNIRDEGARLSKRILPKLRAFPMALGFRS